MVYAYARSVNCERESVRRRLRLRCVTRVANLEMQRGMSLLRLIVQRRGVAKG